MVLNTAGVKSFVAVNKVTKIVEKNETKRNASGTFVPPCKIKDFIQEIEIIVVQSGNKYGSQTTNESLINSGVALLKSFIYFLQFTLIILNNSM